MATLAVVAAFAAAAIERSAAAIVCRSAFKSQRFTGFGLALRGASGVHTRNAGITCDITRSAVRCIGLQVNALAVAASFTACAKITCVAGN